MTPEEIITDKEVADTHANANFGSMEKRTVINLGVLKCASGYYQGSTSGAIIKDHGLVDENYRLTVKGKAYLWAVFGDGNF